MSGVSCVSHDVVRSVPGPNVLIIYRATMILHVSSVPVFGLFPLLSRPSFSQRSARGSTLTCPTKSLCPTQRPLYGLSFPTTIHNVLVPRSLDKIVSVNGTISCAQCDATRSSRASRDAKSRISKQSWPDCRAWCNSCFVTILRVIS